MKIPIAILTLGCAAALLSPVVRADTVQVQGRMQTTADVKDRIVLHVPRSVPEVTVRVPLPDMREVMADAAKGDTRLGTRLAGDVEVTSSATPSSVTDERDASGNRYRVLMFDHPRAGDLTVETQFSHLELQTDLDRALPDVRLPLGDVPAELAQYVRPSKMAQSDDAAIRALAAKITSGAPTEGEAAARIAQWLQSHAHYGTVGNKTDAASMLRNRTGLCEAWAHLFIALARASGLPARFVGGYTIAGTIAYPLSDTGLRNLYVSSISLPHSWVEVWFPGAGWAPYEPQGSAGFVDTHHFPVWTGLDASTNLPLLTWRASSAAAERLSFAEEESVSNVDDDMDLRYAGQSYEHYRPILLSR